MAEKRIKGKIISHCRDNYGEIIVSEENGVRNLYFGDGVLQSSIIIDKPSLLVEEYHQAMMSALMFVDNIRSVLIIGLGGGSLVNFLIGSFPECFIDVVEIREKVIDLFQEFFLYKKDEHLRIFQQAGEEFLDDTGKGLLSYDLIIIDAFDDNGPAGALFKDPLLSALRSRLREGGICVINLWSRPQDGFNDHYTNIAKLFEGMVLRLIPADSYWNAVVLAGINPSLFEDPAALRTKARMIHHRLGVNLPKYLKLMSWQNNI